MSTIDASEPLALSVVQAIHTGDAKSLKRLLAENPGLATARIRQPCDRDPADSRTLLHIATDWPGHFPNGAATVVALVAAGAEIDAHAGRQGETPLHWAASSDDVEVLDALLDHGADINAEGSVIDGGTPLSDAVAFGQWKAAWRLTERGAKANLWQAAALALMDRVEEHFAGGAAPTAEEITNAFWCACHGGQRQFGSIFASPRCRHQLDRARQIDAARYRGAQRGERAGRVAAHRGRQVHRRAALECDPPCADPISARRHRGGLANLRPPSRRLLARPIAG
jgi:hypothetical protein